MIRKLVLFLCGVLMILAGWSIATAEVASPLLTGCGPRVEIDCGEPLCFCKGSHSHVNGHSTGREMR